MATRRVEIELIVDADGAVTGVKTADGALIKLGDAADDTGGRVTRLGRIFEHSLGELAASAVRSLMSSMRQLIGQGWDLLQLGADLAETQSKFNAVFGDGADDVQAFIDAFAPLAGLTKAQAQDYTATLANIAQAQGFARDEAANFSTDILKLAGDLAAFNNVPITQTLDAIRSALRGEFDPIEQFAGGVRAATVQTRALTMSGKENVDQLTEQEKMLAAIALISEGAGKAVGAMEREQDSAAAAARRLEASWQELRNEAAKELLPAAEAVNKELLALIQRDDVSEFIRETAKATAELLVDGIEMLRNVVRFITLYRGEIMLAGKVTGALVASIVAYNTAVRVQILVTKAATIAQRAFNLAAKANPIGLVVAALTAVLPLLWKFRDGIAATGSVFLRFGSQMVRGVGDLVGWFQELIDKIPEGLRRFFPPLRLIEGGFDLLAKGVDATAASLEAGADWLADYAREANAAADAQERLNNAQNDGGGGSGGGSEAGGAGSSGPRAGALRRMGARDTQRNRPGERGPSALDQMAEVLGTKSPGDMMKEEAAKMAEAGRKITGSLNEQEEAELSRQDAFERGLAATLGAADTSIRTAKDAAAAVVGSARRVIRAKLGEVIAKNLAALGPAALIAGPVVAAGLNLLFNKLVPQPKRAGGAVRAGQAYLVGDGPGGQVIPGVTEMFVPASGGRIVPSGQVGSGIDREILSALNRIDSHLGTVDFRLRGNDLEGSFSETSRMNARVGRSTGKRTYL